MSKHPMIKAVTFVATDATVVKPIKRATKKANEQSKREFAEGVRKSRKIERDVREQWLRGAMGIISKAWAKLGVIVPADAQVSCSFPGGGSAHKRIGECWPRARSKANVNELFINPVLEDSGRVLDVLGHEMLHAVDDCASKHGTTFSKNSKKVGYSGGKQSSAVELAAHALIASVITAQGPYPHKEVVITKKLRNESHGLHKFICSVQDEEITEKPDVLYSTAKQVDMYGNPKCRCHGEEMTPMNREKKNLLEHV